MSKLPNGLTIRQTKFCQNLIIPPHNATQAAISAGYSPHIAKTIGSRLKTNPKIQDYLKSLQSDLESQMTVNYEWKLNKLKQIVEAFIKSKENLISNKVNSAIQAISEMNKMQGHYSAERHVNFNIKTDPDLQQLEDLIKQHGKDH
ncbi:MAG TPA: terminase small subunit [Candidatus Aquirickettsiella sp.]|jgi:phage terminase small subunit